MLSTTPFSENFCEQWKSLLQKLYGYQFEADFAVVPSLSGKRTFSYLPLLSYTDRFSSQTDDLFNQLPDGQPYQIRVLNPEYNDFKANEPVTMRLDLRKKNVDELWASFLSKARNQIRKAQKTGLIIKRGKPAAQLRDDFYEIFTITMARYGTPRFDYRLFQLLSEIFKSQYYVVYKENIPISALVVIPDEQIAWVGWAGSRPHFKKYCPNNLMYWHAIQDAFEQGKTIFDFGRSGFGSNTFKFKSQWRAQPVKIDILQSMQVDIYKKYSFASALWKILPQPVANYIGPKLCKYLVDL